MATIFVVNDHVRGGACELVALNAGVGPLSIEEAPVIPEFGDCPFAVMLIGPVYVRPRDGYQVGRDLDNYPCFLLSVSKTSMPGRRFFEPFDLPTAFER